MGDEKSPRKSPKKPKPGELVQPKHGRGLIRHGSTPETAVAGPGRPADVIRQKLRGSFEDRILTLCELADDPKVAPKDRLRAIDVMGKYGVGIIKGVSDEDVRERLKQTLEVIMAELPADAAEALLGKIEPIWR